MAAIVASCNIGLLLITVYFAQCTTRTGFTAKGVIVNWCLECEGIKCLTVFMSPEIDQIYDSVYILHFLTENKSTFNRKCKESYNIANYKKHIFFQIVRNFLENSIIILHIILWNKHTKNSFNP